MEEKCHAKEAIPVLCLAYEQDELRIETMNSAFRNLLPSEVEEWIGRKLTSLVSIHENLSWLNAYGKKEQTIVKIGEKRFLLEEIISNGLYIYVHQPVFLKTYTEKEMPSVESMLDEKDREHAHRILKYVETCGHISHWSFDISEKNFSCSSGVLKLLGINKSEESFEEEEIKQMIHPEDWQELKCVFLEAIRGDAQAISYRTISPDGSVHWMHSHMIPKNFQGVATICGTIQDITSQKKEEEEKIQALVALEKIKMSKKRFVETFAGTLKAPLTRILTLAQILNDEADDEERDVLEEIIFSTDEILTTIEERTVEYTQVEEGQITERTSSHSLEKILEQLSRKMEIFSSARISYQIDKSISSNLNEKEKYDLDNVLSHLMEHLITQVLACQIELVVTIHRACTKFMKLKFEITGSHFSEPLREDGLSKTSAHFLVAQSNAAASGMGLTRQSLGGERERYEFFLRVEKSEPLLEKSNQQDQKGIWRVLVISDLSDGDKGMWNELKIQWHLELDFAKNFEETARALTEREYDFIALDEHLRQGSAIQILSYIRKGHDQNESDIPVIMTTLAIGEESRQTFLQAGANFFVTKPIETAVLTQIIANIKNRRMSRVDRNHPLIYRYVHLKNIEKLKKKMEENDFCEFLLKTIQKSKSEKKRIQNALWPLNENQLLKALQAIEFHISTLGTEDLYESVDMMQSALQTEESVGIEVVGKDFLEEFESFVDELQDFLRRQKKFLNKDSLRG